MNTKLKFNLGICFTLLTAICYAIQTAFIKHSAADISVPVIIFSQSILSLLLLLPILYKKHGFQFLNPFTFSTVKSQHLFRTLTSLGISYFLFLSLQKQPYFDSMLLYNTFPLMTPVIGILILNQRINHNIWWFIIWGFLGVVLILNPDKELISYASILALLSAVCTASSVTMIKKISLKDDSIKSLYYYFLLSSIISGIVILFLPKQYVNFVAPLDFIIIIGVLFFLVQYFLTLATSFINPIIVSILYYSNIIFSLLLSILLFQETISYRIIIGMVFIVLGGLGVIILQKKQIKQTIGEIYENQSNIQ